MMKKVTVVGLCGQSVFLKGKAISQIGETKIYDEMHVELGGKGVNSALTIHRLGGNVKFLTALGKDSYGRECKEFFDFENFNATVIERDGTKTDYGVILTDEDGNNSVSVYQDASKNMTAKDLSCFEDEIKESDYLLTQAEMKDEILLEIAKICKQSGTKIIFDPSPAREFPKEFLQNVWLFTPNETEYENLFKQIIPQRVVITKGGQSVQLIENGVKTTFEVEKVVARNTTGAGDVFNGALMFSLSNNESLFDAIKFAIKASAFKVQSKYVIDGIPTQKDLL